MTPTKSGVITRQRSVRAASKITNAIMTTESTTNMNNSYITIVHDDGDEDVKSETTEIICTLQNKLASANSEIERLMECIALHADQLRLLQLEVDKRDVVVHELRMIINNLTTNAEYYKGFG